jgi:tetratricopeptide (TPR) repeat protein
MALGGWLADHGHVQAALAVYQRFLRHHPAGPGAAEAHLGTGTVYLRAGLPASAYQHLLQVLELDPAPDTRRKASEALRAIADQQKYPMRRYAERLH